MMLNSVPARLRQRFKSRKVNMPAPYSARQQFTWEWQQTNTREPTVKHVEAGTDYLGLQHVLHLGQHVIKADALL